MENRITNFIQNQTVASVSYVNDLKEAGCFSCFYAYDPEKNLLYFKSSISTLHCQMQMKHPSIAGTILPDKLNRLAIQGIQFSGKVLSFDDPLAKNASHIYHKRFPFALAMPGEVWTIELDKIKMTDNTLGFAKKIKWQREEMSLAD